MTKLVLFGRQGCCLCDEARATLLRVKARRPFEFEECDIECDDALLRHYLERIPVVTVDGVELFELFVDEHELERRLSAADHPPPDSDQATPLSRVQHG